MKPASKSILFVLYVLFVAVTFAFYTPPTIVDAVAAFIVPALALCGIYWVNTLMAQGVLGLLRRDAGETKTSDERNLKN